MTTVLLVTAMGAASGSGQAAEGDADLGVTKTANPDSVTPGANVQFHIVVTNNGPSDAMNVQLTDSLPANADFVSATSSQGPPCSGPSENTLSCSLGNLALGESATVDVVLTTPGEAASVTNEADVKSDQNDPNLEDNQASATALPCTTDCTGGWVTDGGTVHGPPLGGAVTQSATLTAPPGVTGELTSENLAESPCTEPEGFDPYGKVFNVGVPGPTEGKRVYVYGLKIIASDDTTIGIPPQEPVQYIELIRKCLPVPRCRGTHKTRRSIPRGKDACVLKIVRNKRTKNVSIVLLDTGQDPPIRGGG